MNGSHHEPQVERLRGEWKGTCKFRRTMGSAAEGERADRQNGQHTTSRRGRGANDCLQREMNSWPRCIDWRCELMLLLISFAFTWRLRLATERRANGEDEPTWDGWCFCFIFHLFLFFHMQQQHQPSSQPVKRKIVSQLSEVIGGAARDFRLNSTAWRARPTGTLSASSGGGQRGVFSVAPEEPLHSVMSERIKRNQDVCQFSRPSQF